MSTTINSTTAATSAAAAAAALPAATGANATTEAQDRFLKLLVTQLKNQDPLNPMDNAQITTQMAQISTVSGIDKLNTTLQDMAASFGASQSLQAAAMIGHNVLVPGNTLKLQNGSAMGGVSLATAADKVTVSIVNGSGLLVHKADLGAQPAGVINFQWDGVTDSGAAAAAGSYTFKVDAVQADKKVDAVGLSLGAVTSISQGKAGASVNIPGMGTVPLSDVKQVM